MVTWRQITVTLAIAALAAVPARADTIWLSGAALEAERYNVMIGPNGRHQVIASGTAIMCAYWPDAFPAGICDEPRTPAWSLPVEVSEIDFGPDAPCFEHGTEVWISGKVHKRTAFAQITFGGPVCHEVEVYQAWGLTVTTDERKVDR